MREGARMATKEGPYSRCLREMWKKGMVPVDQSPLEGKNRSKKQGEGEADRRDKKED